MKQGRFYQSKKSWDIFISYLGIVISLLIAMIIMILPLPGFVFWLKPDLVVLTVIYWAFYMPQRLGIIIAWITGLFIDVFSGTLLGEHAFALAIIIYFTIKLAMRVRLLPYIQQLVFIFGMMLIYQALIFWVQGLLGQLPNTSLYWLSSIISTLAWPLVQFLLGKYALRLQLSES